MIALALAAATLPLTRAATPAERPRFTASSNVAQAEVRIRIVSGSSVALGQSASDPDAQLRSANVMVDGERRSARLVEFP